MARQPAPFGRLGCFRARPCFQGLGRGCGCFSCPWRTCGGSRGARTIRGVVVASFGGNVRWDPFRKPSVLERSQGRCAQRFLGVGGFVGVPCPGSQTWRSVVFGGGPDARELPNSARCLGHHTQRKCHVQRAHPNARRSSLDCGSAMGGGNAFGDSCPRGHGRGSRPVVVTLCGGRSQFPADGSPGRAVSALALVSSAA